MTFIYTDPSYLLVTCRLILKIDSVRSKSDTY